MAAGKKSDAGGLTLPQGLAPPPAVHPELIVFDLDMCMWHPEMYELGAKPTVEVRGRIGGACEEEGVCGARTRRGSTVVLFEGAKKALQELYLLRDTAWAGTRVAAASSSEEPTYSAACLDMLEILPGVKMREVFSYFAIGRTGELSSDKRTHFAKIHRESAVDFQNMLFFDDCNWGDHVAKIYQAHGVLGARTPKGMTYSEWRDALDVYASRRA